MTQCTSPGGSVIAKRESLHCNLVSATLGRGMGVPQWDAMHLAPGGSVIAKRESLHCNLVSATLGRGMGVPQWDAMHLAWRFGYRETREPALQPRFRYASTRYGCSTQ